MAGTVFLYIKRYIARQKLPLKWWNKITSQLHWGTQKILWLRGKI